MWLPELTAAATSGSSKGEHSYYVWFVAAATVLLRLVSATMVWFVAAATVLLLRLGSLTNQPLLVDLVFWQLQQPIGFCATARKYPRIELRGTGWQCRLPPVPLPDGDWGGCRDKFFVVNQNSSQMRISIFHLGHRQQCRGFTARGGGRGGGCHILLSHILNLVCGLGLLCAY